MSIAAALIAILLGRLVHLQVLAHEHYITLSDDNRVKILPEPPNRGLIYDRNGILLAQNLPSYSLEITPEQVPDLEAAAAQYRDTLGADVGPAQDEPDHGVTVVFITLPNTKIELLYPLGEGSPIAGFLEKNPSGGIHHVCFTVKDIAAKLEQLKASGVGLIDQEPRQGALGRLIAFLDPRSTGGVLVELVEEG